MAHAIYIYKIYTKDCVKQAHNEAPYFNGALLINKNRYCHRVLCIIPTEKYTRNPMVILTPAASCQLPEAPESTLTQS
jgi:hypothetical protein